MNTDGAAVVVTAYPFWTPRALGAALIVDMTRINTMFSVGMKEIPRIFILAVARVFIWGCMMMFTAR
jgi:hypothetical protein